MFKDFIVHNFVLIILAVVMIFNALMHFRTSKRISICSILITFFCFILALSFSIQEYAKPRGLYYLALTFAILGYILRPACLYLFILMNKNSYRGKLSFLIWIPLVINAIIFLICYIPGTRDVIFGFTRNTNGSISFAGGPLRYTSHIIAFCYLIYLIYLSVFTLQSKHFVHGFTILSCALFVTIAVVIETFFNPNGDIEILNTTIMVSTVTYYLFLYKESMQVDTLTGLFNRETYYRDYSRMTKSANGIIQFDINGLKYLNDNFGHEEGDKCISTIASLISHNCKKGMYAYRLGGDEFLVIANNTSEAKITKMISSFNEGLDKTEYKCSVGYAIKSEPTTSLEDLIREAEKQMYIDKNNFYKNSPFERRKI